MSPMRVRQYSNDGKHWKYVYRVTAGPLKGRTYSSTSNYRDALARHYGYSNEKQRQRIQLKGNDRDAPKDKKWNQYMQLYVDEFGAPTRNERASFNKLYHQAVKERWSNKKNGAKAKLLDLIGVRSLESYGKWAVGDTPRTK